MALGNHPPVPSSTAPAPTIAGFTFSQIGKQPVFLSRLSDAKATLESSQDSRDQSLSIDDDDDMYAPEDTQALSGDVPMQDAFASNPGTSESRSIWTRLGIPNPSAAPAGEARPAPAAPTPVASTSSTGADISVADQQPSPGAVPGPSEPQVAPTLPSGSVHPTPEPTPVDQAPEELSAIRSLFSSLAAFKIPIPDGLAQLVHTLTSETTTISASAHKAVESAQEALRCAQTSLEAAQTSLASAGSLKAKCREVTEALERLSKENALKKQAWDKTVKETVQKGEEWVQAKEKEGKELRQSQLTLREQNDKLANAARHFKELATRQPPTLAFNAHSDASLVQFPTHVPSPIREKIEAFAKEQMQAYQDEEQAKSLEKERDIEELLRKHQEEMERLASERELLRKRREQARSRISGQGNGEAASSSTAATALPSAPTSLSLRSDGSTTTLRASSQLTGATSKSLATISSATSPPVDIAPSTLPSSASTSAVIKGVASKAYPAQQEASLRQKLKIRIGHGSDRHDNKSMSTSPVSPTDPVLSRSNSACNSPKPGSQILPIMNVQVGGPVVANVVTPLAHHPVPSTLPAKPAGATNPSQQVLGMPTPLPSPNASAEVDKKDIGPVPTSPTDSQPLNKRQAKKMRKASQQSLGSDSSQMTVNHHGSDAGNLSLHTSPTMPAVPFIQELGARRSSAECLKEKLAIKTEPSEASLPQEAAPTQTKVKVKPDPNTSPVIPPVPKDLPATKTSGQAPIAPPAELTASVSSSDSSVPLPPLPLRRKPASQTQQKTQSQVVSTTAASQQPVAAVVTPDQPNAPSAPTRHLPDGPLSYDRPPGVVYPDNQRGQQSAARGPAPREQPRNDVRHRWTPPQSGDDASYNRTSYDHYPRPPYAIRDSPPPRRDFNNHIHQGPQSQSRSRSPVLGHVSRKRTLNDNYESGAMTRDPRRPRYDPDIPPSYSSTSGTTIATVGDHDIDMSALPPRPPMRNQRYRVPSGEYRSWDNGGGNQAGGSSTRKLPLEHRIGPEPPRDFRDRFDDAPGAVIQERIHFSRNSPTSDQGDKAPLMDRLSNPRGRGGKRGGRGGGRGKLKSRITSPE